jgi:hypothetical protein
MEVCEYRKRDCGKTCIFIHQSQNFDLVIQVFGTYMRHSRRMSVASRLGGAEAPNFYFSGEDGVVYLGGDDQTRCKEVRTPWLTAACHASLPL